MEPDFARKFVSQVLPLYAYSPYAIMFRTAAIRLLDSARDTRGEKTNEDLYSDINLQLSLAVAAEVSMNDFLSTIGEVVVNNILIRTVAAVTYQDCTFIGTHTILGIEEKWANNVNFFLVPLFERGDCSLCVLSGDYPYEVRC